MAKTTVAVLFGGRSSEHEISSATAGGVLRAIDRDRYDVIPIGVTRDGGFVLEPGAAAFRLGDAMPEVTENGTRVVWPTEPSERVLRVRDTDGERDLGTVDLVLPLLHGLHGEDGSMQGFLDVLGVPYAGGAVLDSALCMDKHFMKIALAAAGLDVAPGITVSDREAAGDIAARVANLGYPVYVKPARAGSSVGVSRVLGADALPEALRVAFAEDARVLIEREVRGREIEVAVLAGRAGGPIRTSVPGEIVLTGRDFYDYEGKYLGGDGVDVVCPADLPADVAERVRGIAAQAFAAVDGSGLARVDVFVQAGGAIVVNELNTMPGFTEISMYPKCWDASGLGYRDLITELIELGLERSRA